MKTTSASVTLVEPPDAALDDAVTATVTRQEIEAALGSQQPVDLSLDVRRTSADGDTEERRVDVAWERADLERLLADAEASAITFSFAREELERAFDEPEVEAHGLRERALILTVAAAAASGASAFNAAAGLDRGTGASVSPAAVNVHHGEAATASQLASVPNDEAGLAARGIQTGAVHDEASFASRGIEAPPAAHDEASLAARGIQTGAVHDEASFASRGIEAPPAAHDEASLAARGIGVSQAVHDEASLVARGIESAAPAGGGSGFDLPTLDASTAAISAGVAGGVALLITAAGFAARRGRNIRPA